MKAIKDVKVSDVDSSTDFDYKRAEILQTDGLSDASEVDDIHTLS